CARYVRGYYSYIQMGDDRFDVW
nr:immunoglobulin heavy chain junction region [Macaca mulatta]